MPKLYNLDGTPYLIASGTNILLPNFPEHGGYYVHGFVSGKASLLQPSDKPHMDLLLVVPSGGRGGNRVNKMYPPHPDHLALAKRDLKEIEEYRDPNNVEPSNLWENPEKFTADH